MKWSYNTTQYLTVRASESGFEGSSQSFKVWGRGKREPVIPPILSIPLAASEDMV